MQAIHLNRLGGPETLEPVDIDKPEATPGRVVVAVAAAGINFIDIYHRTGLYPLQLPFVPGLEGAGTVVAVGEGVTTPGVGDLVAWTDVAGSYAEYVSLPAERTVPVPDGIDPEVAAAVMLQGVTAHYLATATFVLAAGHRCLIHAGAGGVGRLLIQIAKLRGAEVFTTVGDEAKVEIAAAAGADHVIEYRKAPFRETIEAIVGPRPFDVVYDGVGADTFDDGLRLLRPRGLMVAFGNASGPVPPISPLELSRNGSLFLTRPTMGDYIRERPEFEARTRDLFEWIREGRLEVLIGGRYPLREAARAHRHLEARLSSGKLLLIPGS